MKFQNGKVNYGEGMPAGSEWKVNSEFIQPNAVQMSNEGFNGKWV